MIWVYTAVLSGGGVSFWKETFMGETTDRKYELLLAVVIAARASSFMFSKILLESMGAFDLMAIRFLLAFMILCVIFPKKLRMNRRTFLSGLAVGVMYFLVMSCELKALQTADSSLVSLLENCAIIFVPVIETILIRKLPKRITTVCTAVAFAGVVCLALQQGRLTGSFGWGLMSAVLYALAIIVTSKVTSGEEDPLSIGIVQLGTMGGLSLAAAAGFRELMLPGEPRLWMMILALAVICSSFGFAFQTVAQSRVSAARAGLFCAISPAVSAILGVVVLREHLGLLGVVGLVLILFSIALPYLRGGSVSSRSGRSPAPQSPALRR